MARLPRIDLPNTPQHIVQRGNNKQACFACNKDFKAYLGWLKEYSRKFNVDIHAWVLMTNHVHILCTPRESKSISLLMQSVGRRYVQYFNYTYKRTGTLWEGRYKASVVQEKEYLLQVYRYIELNPVRALMVEDPAYYTWSSYQINALGKASDLCTPHSLYLGLGDSKLKRVKCYRELFQTQIEPALVEDIRLSLNKGLALGNDRFKDEIEYLTQRRAREGIRGRIKGWNKQSR